MEKNVFCCLFKGQQTTDFGHALPELVEGITLGTSTRSVTEQLSTKKRRVKHPLFISSVCLTRLYFCLVVFKNHSNIHLNDSNIHLIPSSSPALLYYAIPGLEFQRVFESYILNIPQ